MIKLNVITLIKTLIFVIFILLSFKTYSQDFTPLWPEGKMPNSKGLEMQDSIKNQRYIQVSNPGIYSYFPAPEDNTGAAVIICPGGGYGHVTINWNGFQFAKWFNAMGVNAFVLNYRLPHSPDLKQRELGPLQDAQRAVKIVRAHANKWNIDPEKIGVMGISAGGHLAASLGVFQEDVASINDSLDEYGFTPEFMILVSPVITMGEYTHEGSRQNLLGKNPSQELIDKFSMERQVHTQTPPAFLVHAYNDGAVDPRNSIMFYVSLLEHDVMSTLHIFPKGGHGIALRDNPGSTENWTELCEMWMKEMGWLNTEE